MTEQNSTQLNLSTLRDLMNARFNDEELQRLCMDLDVGYQDIPGKTTSGKVMGLIEYLQHRDRLPELMEKLRERRPEGKWNTVYQADPAEAKSDEPAQPERANLKTKNARSKRQTVGVVGLILLILIAAAVWLAQSGRFCPYHGQDDYETIVQIIKAESQAINNGNLAIIKDIFAADAYLKKTEKDDGTVTEWFDPLARYGPLLDNTRFYDARHDNIEGTVDGRYARFTSGSQGSYVTGDTYGEYHNEAGNPNEEEVWTLEKNLCGCWQITQFEFH